MTNEEYDLIIKKHIVKENVFKNIIIAFFSGGIVGIIAELLTNIFVRIGYSINDGYLLTTCIFIIVGSVLTGLGFFDKVLSFCKCGLLVPTTGFSNSMTSSAMDARREGFVKGIGSSMFKLTGSIILYGIVFGIIFGYIRSIL